MYEKMGKIRVQFKIEEVRFLRLLLLEKYQEKKKLRKRLVKMKLQRTQFVERVEEELTFLRRLLKKIHKHSGLNVKWYERTEEEDTLPLNV